MKKYIFFTGDIYPLGGIQIYLSGKIKYLEKQGWEIYTFFYGFTRGKCTYPKLNEYTDGKFKELYFLPCEIPQFVVKNTLNKMKKLITYNSEDEIFIESHYDVGAIWGELLAEKVKGHHTCLCCNELFRGNGKYYYDYVDFFKFKYDRYELAGISEKSMSNLFEGVYHNIPVDKSHLFSATPDNQVQDIECALIRDIENKDFNICYIGRAKKESFKFIAEGVKNFALKYADFKIQFIIVGDFEEEDKKITKKIFEKCENIILTYTGTLTPVPSALFLKIDIAIAGSGCAIMSALEKVPTILIDAKDYKSNGLLGYDTNEFLFREKNGKCEEIDETLENCLIKHTYDNKEFTFKYNLDRDEIYRGHFRFFDNSTKGYYQVKLLQYPKRITLKNILKLVYFKVFKKETIIQ